MHFLVLTIFLSPGNSLPGETIFPYRTDKTCMEALEFHNHGPLTPQQRLEKRVVISKPNDRIFALIFDCTYLGEQKR